MSQSNHFQCLSTILKKYAKGPFNSKKPLLKFASKVDNNKKKNSGGSRGWECHICKKHYFGSYTRVYCHLLWIGGQGVKGCKKITAVEKEEANRLHVEGETLKAEGPIGTTPTPTPTYTITSSKGKGKAKRDTNVAELFNIQAKERAKESIGRFLYARGIPFHVCRSSYFKQMCKDIYAAGPSFIPPGETKLRTTILDKEYSKVSILMEDMRQTWMSDGCSIIMDGWTDIKHRPLINLIVTSTAGAYFLRAVDCSKKRKDASFQFEILKDAKEEIGASNVVKVVTDSAQVCKSIGLIVESACNVPFPAVGHLDA